MDTIRFSEVENGGYYKGDYTSTYQTDDVEVCRNICVSDKDCEVWKYVPGVCTTSTSSGEWINEEGHSGGIVRTRKYYSLVQFIVFILFLILFAVALTRVGKWYFSMRNE